MRNEKQAERRQRGEDFQEECRRSWRQIPNLWRLRITDGGNLGTRPADELVLLEHVNLLCEEKGTDGDRFKLSMLRADQLTGLINFEKALDRNIGLVLVSFLNEAVDVAYAFRVGSRYGVYEPKRTALYNAGRTTARENRSYQPSTYRDKRRTWIRFKGGARLHVYESNNIRVSGYPLPLKLKIVDDLTIDNPAYLKAKYQRRPTWGIDQKLQLFTYDNDGSLILPRGYADRLYSLISETTTSIKWDKEQVEGEPDRLRTVERKLPDQRLPAPAYR